jgi:prophage regulatory protein
MMITHHPDAAPLRLIGAEQVGELIGVSRSHVDYLRRIDATFPRPVKLGASFNAAVRFVAHEVDAWIAARIAARDADAARVRARGVELARRLHAARPPGTRVGGRKARDIGAAIDRAAAATRAGGDGDGDA